MSPTCASSRRAGSRSESRAKSRRRVPSLDVAAAVELFVDRAARARSASFAPDAERARRDRADLPPARRTPARHRAGRRPHPPHAPEPHRRRRSTTGSGCSRAGVVPRCRGSGRSKRRWLGVTISSTTSSEPSSAGWPSSKGASRSKRPKQSWPTARSSTTFAVLDGLGRLVDKSLVQLDADGAETRYRLLETIRQYARERLVDAHESDPTRERHFGFFSSLAEDRRARAHDRCRTRLARARLEDGSRQRPGRPRMGRHHRRCRSAAARS